jgi:peptidoglycan/xylan/chitin deacetylase (PgdA/CDA1 family)
MIWKTAVLLTVAFVMAAGLIAFAHNRNTLTHQRPYYMQGYLALAKYRIEQALGVIHARPTQADAASQDAAAVPVLLYHGIGSTAKGEDISLGSFADQMIALEQAGYHTISIDDYYDFMRHGKHLPAKSILLTFDDGRKDSYYPVQPIMQALGLRATMFVITKASLTSLSPKYYLDATELAAMRDSGHWDLQPHAAYGHFYYPVDAKGTLGHFYNNKLWLPAEKRVETDQEFAARVLRDLQTAKSDMTDTFGSSGVAFAFPYSEFGLGSLNYPGAGAVLLQAVKSIFPIAFYQVWPNRGNTQNYPENPDFMMKRVLVDDKTTPDSLLQRLTDSAAKNLPYRSNMVGSTGSWLSTWGIYSWGPQGLTIRAEKAGYGASMFLDGAGAWKDFTAKAHLKLQDGNAVRMYARYIDDHNYASCTYTPNGVLLEETITGDTHVLTRSYAPLPLDDLNAGVTVEGRHMECQTGGESLVSENLDPSLSAGGIGFAGNGSQLGASHLLISDVSADGL